MAGFKRLELPPGTYRDLFDALHLLHRSAGCPSARELQRALGVGVASHTSVHKIFTGASLPRWGLVELVVEAMARQARRDERTEVERFRALWASAQADLSAKPIEETLIPGKSNEPNQPTSGVGLSAPIIDTLSEALDELEAVGANSAVGSFRIPTGLDSLDALLGGWPQGCLTIIGGRPSAGKTALLLQFCRAASVRYRLPSMLLSGEVNNRELQLRLLAAEARVPLHSMRTGQMSEEDWTRVAHAMRTVAHSPINIGTPAGFSLDQLSAEITTLAKKNGVKLVLIDSLQWASDHADAKGLTAESFLRYMKRLAETLKISVIVTAHAEKAHNAEPLHAEAVKLLKESDAIEAVADVIIILNRPDQDDPCSPRAGETDLMIVKNRNGPTSTLTVVHMYHYVRFADMTPIEYPVFRVEPKHT